MLVESLALREANNARALAVKHRWLDTDFIPKKSYAGIPTLTDNASNFAPAFWVQQMHFFNGDFRTATEFETFFNNQQQADKLYSADALLGEAFRYGLTAGLFPNPLDRVYHADSDLQSSEQCLFAGGGGRLGRHGHAAPVLSTQQIPTSNPSYQVRPGPRLGGAAQLGFRPTPGWSTTCSCCSAWSKASTRISSRTACSRRLHRATTTPTAASTSPTTISGNRILDRRPIWRPTATTTIVIDAGDYTVWRNNYSGAGAGQSVAVPEPISLLCSVSNCSLVADGSGCEGPGLRNLARPGFEDATGGSTTNRKTFYESACNPCFLVLGCESTR